MEFKQFSFLSLSLLIIALSAGIAQAHNESASLDDANIQALQELLLTIDTQEEQNPIVASEEPVVQAQEVSLPQQQLIEGNQVEQN